MRWIGKMYDGNGHEIELKPGHYFIIGDGWSKQIPMDNYEAKFVYKDPVDGKLKELISEFGSNQPVDFITSEKEEL